MAWPEAAGGRRRGARLGQIDLELHDVEPVVSSVTGCSTWAGVHLHEVPAPGARRVQELDRPGAGVARLPAELRAWWRISASGSG